MARIDHEEQLNTINALLTLIGFRWFVLASLVIVAIALAPSGSVDGVTLYHIGIVLASGFIGTLITWAIAHGAGVSSVGGMRFVKLLHVLLFVGFLMALLWVVDIREPWGVLLFLLPVVESAFLYGVGGVVGMWSIALVGSFSFFAFATEVAVITPFFLLLGQLPNAALDAASHFVPLGLALVGAGLVVVAGSHVRVRREELLRDARKRAYALLVELDEGIVFYDDKSVIQYVNPAAERILGVQRRDVIGQQIGRFATIAAPGTENLSKVMFLTLNDSRARSVELSDPDRTVMVAERSMFGPNGEPLGYARLLRDVTQEQRVGRLKSEFISVAAHQLRTPMSGIKWAMEELKEDETLQGRTKSVVAEAEEAADRMIALVGDLLDVARIEEGRFEYHFVYGQLEEIVQTVVDDMRHQANTKGLTLRYDAPSDALPPIHMDEEKIRVLLETLLDNAIHYTPVDGRVTVGLTQKQEELIFSIADTGVGIPENQQDQVFTKFFRGDNVVRMQTEGTGLGLFIAQNIVDRHNGRIWFESEPGTGTTFYVALPIEEVDRPVEEAEESD